MNEPKLGEILHNWKVGVTTEPRFAAEVWSRIRTRDEARGTGTLGWLRTMFSVATWRMAAVTTVMLILAGAGLGARSANVAKAKVQASLEMRYVASIDPYLQTPQ